MVASLFTFLGAILISPTSASASTLKILTYNVWTVDAPFNLGSRDIEARMAAIPKAVSETGADVISFQEVWPDKYKVQLANEFKKYGYNYAFFENPGGNMFLRGIFGNGLLIISKFPLEIPDARTNRLLKYKEFTRPDEYFVAKGVLHVVVRVNKSLAISLYDTHMGAVSFDPEKKQYSSAHEERRQKQAVELFNFIRKTAHARPVVLAGDFNSYFDIFSESETAEQPSSDYQMLTCSPASEKCLGLSDSAHPTPHQSDEHFSVDPVLNPYTDTSPVYRYRAPRRTLDYIFVSRCSDLPVAGSKIVLSEKLTINGRSEAAPLSDHFAVLATLTY